MRGGRSEIAAGCIIINPPVPKPPKRIKSIDMLIEVHLRDGCECLYCGEKTVQLDTHHIKLRSQGGHDILENLVSLCWNCHRRVHDAEIKAEELREILNKKYGYC